MKKHSRIFISYRREGGAEMARLIRDRLRERGYNVFMDVEDLRSGPFNTALFEQIQNSTDFLVVLTPGSMDRCANKDDWLRLELAYAIKCKKNIVPIMTRGFEWPSGSLPDDLREVSDFNGLEASHNYFDASMNRLAELLVGQPKSRPHLTGPIVAALVFVVLACIAVAFLAYLWLYHKPSPPANFSSSPESARIVLQNPADEANRISDANDIATEVVKLLKKLETEANDNRENTVEISSKITAKIVELPFKEGDRVTKGISGANGSAPGSILVRLDATDLEEELRSIEAIRDAQLTLIEAARRDIEKKQKEVKSQEDQLELMERNMQRYKGLLETKDIAQATFDAVQSKLEKQQSSLISAQENLTSSNLQLETLKLELKATEERDRKIKENLKNTVITSPVDGIVTKINNKVGDIVTATTDTQKSVIMEVTEFLRTKTGPKTVKND